MADDKQARGAQRLHAGFGGVPVDPVLPLEASILQATDDLAKVEGTPEYVRLAARREAGDLTSKAFQEAVDRLLSE